MKKQSIALTTDAHRPAFNDFADAMRVAESCEGWRSSEVLRHFLEAAMLALKGKFLLGDAFEKNEAEYMAIVGRCHQPQKTMGALARMMAALTTALWTEPVDFIGPVFSELSADAGMGQFFTPHTLSYLMAKMMVGDDLRERVAERGYVSFNEPACGVGGMILATNVALREAGLDVAREVHWVAIDVDYRAFAACWLQLALTDCSADVYRGNALGPPENLSGIRTPAALLFPKRAPKLSSVEATIPDVSPTPPQPDQLSLF